MTMTMSHQGGEQGPATSFQNIGWTVGNHCNATCGHCYSWKVRRDSREFLTHSDIDRVVEQLVALGVHTVNLGGNEPIYTHGPDIRQTVLPYIVSKLTEAGIPVGLTTNGVTFTYLDEHHPEELAMINDIDFSLDSPFAREHDLNRGGKLYRLVIEAMQRAVELGIDCSVIACGMRQNFTPEYLSAYLALTQELGSEFRVNTLKPVEASLLKEMPSKEQFYEGFAFLMQNSSCITLGESCISAFARAGSQGCPCGTSSFRINAKTKTGRISINPCVYMHDFAAGDLLTESIFDIVSSPQFTAFARRRAQLPKACKESGCAYLETCRGGCSARSYLVYGDLESRDPYCPQQYVDQHGKEPAIPKEPPIGCHDGIRVHDNYLCTWIGKVHETYQDPVYTELAQFFEEHDQDPKHMSNCKQVDSTEGRSLVSSEEGTEG
jgi:radical SAM protein with 4Fe4S-binding SPASM domain